jgi:hypothetical protein
MEKIIIELSDLTCNHLFIRDIRKRADKNFATIAGKHYIKEKIKCELSTINPNDPDRYRACVNVLTQLNDDRFFAEKEHILKEFFATNDKMVNPLTTTSLEKIREYNFRMAKRLKPYFKTNAVSFPDLFSDLHRTKLQCNNEFITLLDIFLSYSDMYKLDKSINAMIENSLILWRSSTMFTEGLLRYLKKRKIFNKLSDDAIEKIEYIPSLITKFSYHSVCPQIIHI